MNDATNHVRATSVAGNALQRLGDMHLAWQQLCWQLALTPWAIAWPPRPGGSAVAGLSPAPAGHDQLVVPPAVAADGEHALFA